jgi:hypothetical protein
VKWSRLRRLGPWWAVALTAAVGIGLAAVGLIRLGGYVLAGALAFGAIVRALLPRVPAGGIAVRTRWMDVATLGGLAVAVFTAFSLLRL